MYDDAVWLPICAGLSAVGLVAAFFAFRRRGLASGLRLLGWAAVPMAVYLTGLARLLWTIGFEVGRWIGGFVFSPVVWAGLALFAFTAIALPVAAMIRRRRAGSVSGAGDAAGGAVAGDAERGQIEAKAPEVGKKAAKSKSAQPKSAQPKSAQKAGAADPLEGMDDVEEILKRRGIS
jgi:hypothetical protein